MENVENASEEPAAGSTLSVGASAATVRCDENYEPSGLQSIDCINEGGNGVLSDLPTCVGKSLFSAFGKIFNINLITFKTQEWYTIILHGIITKRYMYHNICVCVYMYVIVNMRLSICSVVFM